MLRAAVVMDYQNVHLTGHEVFSTPGQRPHETLIHPYSFASQLLARRNERAPSPELVAELACVEVYRGLPSADIEVDAYARNLANAEKWCEHPEVRVHHRPLQYDFQRDATGSKVRDVNGRFVPTGGKREKGIDVLCALSMVRLTLDESIDVVILASRDSDLTPALDEAHDLNQAKIETGLWYDKENRRTWGTHKTTARLWSTRMDAQNFDRSIDRNFYA